jgi:hypothetical protein
MILVPNTFKYSENFQGVLRENKEHVDALTEYAPLVYPLGSQQREEAMTIMLTVLINKGGKLHTVYTNNKPFDNELDFFQYNLLLFFFFTIN